MNKNNMPKNKWILFIILIILGVCCLIAAGVILIYRYRADRQSQKTVEALRASAESYGQTPTEADPTDAPAFPTATPAPSLSPAPTPQPTPQPVENPYQDAFLANEDMAAWLVIPDTPVDYPVMWTPRDENYYLRRGFDGKKNQNGCLILDTDSCIDPLTTNLIIHGHNMKSGAMFGELEHYREESFFQDHREMQLHTREGIRTYEVVAVFLSQVYRKTDQVFKFYQFFQADTEEEFDDFYENIKAMSLYDTGVTASYGDHFLTLSTCAYHVEQGRFVVVARETGYEDIYAPFDD
ncbi:MAG: class B sortase [Muribaculum sp.]|nr:class B sortase [Muribaculum sp.]